MKATENYQSRSLTAERGLCVFSSLFVFSVANRFLTLTETNQLSDPVRFRH